jgi:DNA helicase TIP49 (TBP-interacting protein)
LAFFILALGLTSDGRLRGVVMGTVADYRSRIGDGLLAKAFQASRAVEIVGPKWCGKTTMAERTAKSAAYLQDPDRLRCSAA